MMIDTAAAKEHQLAWVSGSCLLLVGAAALALPVIREAWGERLWFEAVFLAGVFLLDAQIALFLTLQALAGGQSARALAWLAGGYAFAAIAAAGMFFVQADIAAATRGAEVDDAARWLWVARHVGFPCFVLAALRAKAAAGAQPRRDFEAGDTVGALLTVALGAATAVAAVIGVIANAAALPDLGEGRMQLAGGPVGAIVVLLNVFALMAIVYMTRLRELLFLWLALAVFAFTLDVVLSLAGSARYTAGWYVGHALSLASSAAVMGALLIENFRLHRDAEVRAAFHEQEAMHDPLTGLFNRRYLMEKLPEELGRARRYRYPVSLLMVDADHFKSINDKGGHGVGDECLRALAHALARRVHRFGDYSARYGGEEFVVVLPECDLAGAVEVAEEIRGRVENLHGQGAAPTRLTVSIGVATASPGAGTPAEELLAAADRCLYRAKRMGRNRVAWPEGQTATPNLHAV